MRSKDYYQLSADINTSLYYTLYMLNATADVESENISKKHKEKIKIKRE